VTKNLINSTGLQDKKDIFVFPEESQKASSLKEGKLSLIALEKQ